MTSLNPSRRPYLTRLAAIALVLASLLNGTGYLLRRVGWLDPAGYRNDLLRFCRHPVQELWLPLSCHFQRILSLDPLQSGDDRLRKALPQPRTGAALQAGQVRVDQRSYRHLAVPAAQGAPAPCLVSGNGGRSCPC